jgi:hypothetical protein
MEADRKAGVVTGLDITVLDPFSQLFYRLLKDLTRGNNPNRDGCPSPVRNFNRAGREIEPTKPVDAGYRFLEELKAAEASEGEPRSQLTGSEKSPNNVGYERKGHKAQTVRAERS